MGVDIFLNRSIQSYVKPGRLYTSRQLFEMKVIAFRTLDSSELSELTSILKLSELTFMYAVGFKGTKVFSTIRNEITVDGSFQRCTNPANSWS